MADYQAFHDPATGQNYIRPSGGTQVIPVSKDDIARLEEGGLEAFAKSAVNSTGQLITGAGALVDQALLGGTEARSRYDAFRDEQEMRSIGNPVASFAGSVAPDVVVGLGTGGGSLAARIGGTAAVEGALGAARNPDDPLMGALVQGGLGAGGAGVLAGAGAVGRMVRGTPHAVDATEAVRGVVGPARMADRVSGRIRGAVDDIRARIARDDVATMARPAEEAAQGARGLSADIARAPAASLRSRRVLDEAADSETMMDRYAFPMTKTQAAMLDTFDTAEFGALRSADAAEELASRTEPTIVEALRDSFGKREQIDFKVLAREQQQAVNRAFNAELGMPDEGAVVQRQAVGKRMRELGDEMDQLIRDYAEPMEYRATMDGLRMNDIIERNGLAGAQEAEVMRQVEERLAGKFHPDLSGRNYIAGEDLAEVINAIGKRADGFLKNVETLSVGRALNDVRMRLTRMMQRDWDREAVEDYTRAQRQWAIAKDLTRGGANLSARGDVNMKSYMGSYRSGDSLYRSGRRNGDWERFLDAAGAVMFRETPNSGTPTGMSVIMNRAMDRIPGSGLLK